MRFVAISRRAEDRFQTLQTIVSSAYNIDRGAVHTTNFQGNMKLFYLTIMQNFIELSGKDPLQKNNKKELKT